MRSLVGTTLLQRYFLRELVGSGGMADVYLAWDQLRSTKMAVKILRRDLAHESKSFQLFAQEAELLRRLEHPNIVRLYEFEKEGDIVFIIMDWVEGQDLKHAIAERKKPYTTRDVSRILHPISIALNYAHQNRVYHCDIKPANILLCVDGKVLLTDFGVARLAQDRTSGGTPPYMAPEQFSGGDIDGRTDVYALGITLYEMLSGGVVPFRGDSPNSHGSTLQERIEWEHLNASPPPLRQVNPKVSQEVESVIATALSKDPFQRYASPLDLEAAFEHARELKKEEDLTVYGPKRDILPSRPAHDPQPNLLPVSHLQEQKAPPTQHQITGPYLLGRTGDWEGQRITIPRDGLTIGRGGNNQLRMREPSVSRSHAVILRTRRGVYIRDEHSALGTYINGAQIPTSAPIQLHDGDVIQIGYYQVFEYRGR